MNTQLRLALTLAASLLCVSLAGCGVSTADGVEDAAGKTPEVNICDGQPHKFGDVVVQVTKIRLDGKSIHIEGETRNESEGAIIETMLGAELIDNYGNRLEFVGDSVVATGMQVRPGNWVPFFIEAHDVVDATSSWRLILLVNISKDANGIYTSQEVQGTFTRESLLD